MSLPGLVCLLVALAAVERLGRWTLPWRRGRGTPLSAAGIDEVTALFYATKHHELQQRRTELVLRDDQGDGDRPFRFDLDRDGAPAAIAAPRDDH
jgi:uncharacterized protein DUF6191